MAREMQLSLSTFVQENGRIKYVEYMCRVLRVGVDKCCKGKAGRALLMFISVLAFLHFFSDCQPRSDRWCVVEPGSKLG